MSTDATKGTPAKPAAHPPSAQNDWFARNRGTTIRVRFTDGTALVGTLLAWDTYTIVVAVSGEAEPVLVQKHAVAYFARGEGGAGA
jgi:sRNA-binding regulator protein Hfq